jgi:hypothetical protein
MGGDSSASSAWCTYGARYPVTGHLVIELCGKALVRYCCAAAGVCCACTRLSCQHMQLFNWCRACAWLQLQAGYEALAERVYCCCCSIVHFQLKLQLVCWPRSSGDEGAMQHVVQVVCCASCLLCSTCAAWQCCASSAASGSEWHSGACSLAVVSHDNSSAVFGPGAGHLLK